MNQQLLVICYTENGNKSFGEFQDIRQFTDNHPNTDINYIFDQTEQLVLTNNGLKTKADIIDKLTEISDYNQLCIKYGFFQSEYKIQVRFPDRPGTYELFGFNPRNKKYKCLLREIDSGKLLKAEPSYLRKLVNQQNI